MHAIGQLLHHAVHRKEDTYNGTSTPWTVEISSMREPQPFVWAFDDDGLLKPTEFRYAEKQDAPWTEKEHAFIVKLKELLSQRGLDKKFGLARYPGDNFGGSCEITEGNANINLKPEDYPPDLVHIPTIWFFSAPLWQRGCRCTCNANAPNHPHGTHVYTVSGR
ncbi:hypothetical protein M011DRAFT_454412 [Sporormia fimetaria CBS 119925]|uniref:Uncharacterized protein n=1 Tax=Sporormia fimetaria CBS 119925 TaxID=1340428 RepID=A0A6A6UVC0_9PLEO|nr:hypothetical protein M011DRAFT_454412 [Sporormia fimetaria CBS 119925]